MEQKSLLPGSLQRKTMMHEKGLNRGLDKNYEQKRFLQSQEF
jgi:hypothetical protein